MSKTNSNDEGTRTSLKQSSDAQVGDTINENKQSVGKWWNPLSFNPWKLATNSCSSADNTIVDWCGTTTNELEEFDAAVKVLLGGDYDGSGQIQQKSEEGYTRIEYCRQLERWDCGIACVLMILRWLRDDQGYPNNSMLTDKEMKERAEMIRMVRTESVWTADLVLLLDQLFRHEGQEDEHQQRRSRQPRHRFLFCSKTFQVDTEHRNLSYYSAAFSNDQIRVSEKFSELRRLNTPMLCISKLPLKYVLGVVTNRHCVAIVLVDNSTLFTSSSASGSGDGAALGGVEQKQDVFTGHYVILCGISTNPQELSIAQSFDNDDSGRIGSEDFCVVILDPGKPNIKTMYATPKRFERAWRTKGTDNDIIFIAKDTLEEL